MKTIISIKDTKLYKVIDLIVFVLMSLAAGAAMVKLFYRQGITENDYQWLSDIKPYIQEMLGTNDRYNFPYPILFKTGSLVNKFVSSPEMAMAITVASFNVLAMCIVKYLFEKQTGARFLSTFATCSLFFLSMIYSKSFNAFGIQSRYIGVYSPNPWHNHTFMAARPFMIIAFIFGAYTLASYESVFAKESKPSKKNYLMFVGLSVSLLLATMTKPSYTLVHMGVVGIVVVFRTIKSRFGSIRQALIFAAFYIPTIIDLLYQYSGVFTSSFVSGEDSGIGIAPFEMWAHWCDNIPLAIVLAAGFPIIVLAFNYKKLKTDNEYCLSWQSYAMSLIMAIIFIEKGFRAYHGNFMWGYMCGLFLIFFTSIRLLLKETMSFAEGKLVASRKIILAFEWIMLMIHTLLGMYYFYILTIYAADYY